MQTNGVMFHFENVEVHKMKNIKRPKCHHDFINISASLEMFFEF